MNLAADGVQEKLASIRQWVAVTNDLPSQDVEDFWGDDLKNFTVQHTCGRSGGVACGSFSNQTSKRRFLSACA